LWSKNCNPKLSTDEKKVSIDFFGFFCLLGPEKIQKPTVLTAQPVLRLC